MRALRYHGLRDLRLDDIDEPAVRPGTVKLAVGAAGICGSDIHEYVGGPISVPMTQPHPMTGEVAPVVFGHEFAGTITEVGAGVQALAVGDRIAANAALWCGSCDACQQGWTNICRTVGFHGVTGGGGAFAAYDVIPERNAHVLPATISDEVGALLEPLATGFHAVELAGLGAGDESLILGAGPIGLMVVQACVAAGVEQIIVAEPSPTRRTLAARLGATVCFDPLDAVPADVVRDATSGRGVAASFDAAAARSTLDDAVAATRPRGTVISIAAWEKPAAFNPTSLLFRETVIRGSLAYTSADFDRAVTHATSHTAELKQMVSRVIALDDVIDEGFDKLAFSAHDDVKVLVRPAMS